MDRNQFTVLFQAPFWVGIAERWDGEGYQAARVVFGPQPTDAQVYEWLLREWHRLRFSPAVLGKTLPQGRKNPKRALREARAATQDSGASTRAQEALSRQREQEGLLRQSRDRQKRREELERKYRLRQEKKREKKRGR